MQYKRVTREDAKKVPKATSVAASVKNVPKSAPIAANSLTSEPVQPPKPVTKSAPKPVATKPAPKPVATKPAPKPEPTPAPVSKPAPAPAKAIRGTPVVTFAAPVAQTGPLTARMLNHQETNPLVIKAQQDQASEASYGGDSKKSKSARKRDKKRKKKQDAMLAAAAAGETNGEGAVLDGSNGKGKKQNGGVNAKITRTFGLKKLPEREIVFGLDTTPANAAIDLPEPIEKLAELPQERLLAELEEAKKLAEDIKMQNVKLLDENKLIGLNLVQIQRQKEALSRLEEVNQYHAAFTARTFPESENGDANSVGSPSLYAPSMYESYQMLAPELSLNDKPKTVKLSAAAAEFVPTF